MATLLHIDSSAMPTGSVSKDIATTFRKAWQEVDPDGTVTHRDLGLNPVPPLLADGISAAFTPEGQRQLDATQTAIQDAEAAVLAPLAPAEREQFRAMLRTLASHYIATAGEPANVCEVVAQLNK
jgi:FMN-dependent NADH-azoreductase